MFPVQGCASVALVVALALSSASAFAASGQEKAVSFQTEDGWTIHGTLRVPEGATAGSEVPGVLLLHKLGHDRTDYDALLKITGLADDLKAAGLAALSIDWRGRGESMGAGEPVDDELDFLSPATREQMHLDVKGALAFLAAQPGVDRHRVAVVASEGGVEHAVRAIRESALPVAALALLSGYDMSDASKAFLGSTDMPLFVSSSTDDKRAFGEMAAVYAASRNKASYVLTADGGASGYDLFLLEYLQDATKTAYRRDKLEKWLIDGLKSIGRVRAISFQTEDGWTLHGNFRFPDDLGRDERRRPAIIAVPGARSDQFALLPFVRELARRGYPVLSIELRGRGQSIGASGRGSEEVKALYTNLDEVRVESDVKAAVNFLVTQKGVDPTRIGILGEAIGTKASMLASAGDARVKTLALVSAYGGDDPEVQRVLGQSTIPMLLIDSEKNTHTRVRTELVHKLTMKNSRMVIYPGIGQGHHMPDFHPEVIELIGAWMDEQLR